MDAELHPSVFVAGVCVMLGKETAQRVAEINEVACELRRRVAVLEGERDRAVEAVERLRNALDPFLEHPRWLSIGSENNTVEIRVSAMHFDAAKEARAALESLSGEARE